MLYKSKYDKIVPSIHREAKRNKRGKAWLVRQSATRESKRDQRGMAWREGCGATRDRQHDERGGGAPSDVVDEAAVHRFITQQPTLFKCIPVRVGGNFYNDDDDEEEENINDNDHNEDDNDM